MASRGVHFALEPDELSRLLAVAGDDAALVSVIDEIEAKWDIGRLAESDKAWDAIHRCLTDGSLLYESGEYPLNHVICGGRQLLGDGDYTVSLVTPEQVKDVACALGSVTEAWLRERYFALLDPDDYEGEIGDRDFEYTWGWFQNVRELFRTAALANRAVIFTVDA